MRVSRLLTLGALLLSIALHSQNDAKQLIEEVVEAAGGKDRLYALKDVQYEYTFKSKEKGLEDISIERYIFKGEHSFAEYTQREYYALPPMQGTLTQHYNGVETVSMLNESKLTEQQPAFVGHFFRKTNYYWFTMIYKLLDPGVNLKMMNDRTVGNKTYKVVEMTFEKGVGETSDRYLLYVNPETKMIDQFLFTVLGFGFEEPFLMKMQYEEVNGLMLSTYREYAPANWQGEVIKQEWNQQISRNIRFNNGFEPETLNKL